MSRRRGALVGLALGILWGVAARAWMALLASDPEFTWAGTLGILGLAGFFGSVVGLARAALRQGRSGWWRLVVVPGLALFLGPGLLLLPGAVVTGMAIARRSRRRWWLVAAAALASLVTGFLDPESVSSVRQMASFLVGMPLLILAIGWWWQDVFVSRPRPASSGEPGQEALDANPEELGARGVELVLEP